MLRWCLSTSRIFGGHDSNPRLSSIFNSQTLRLSSSRSSCTPILPAVPVTNLVEELGTPLLISLSDNNTGPKNALHLSSGPSTNLLEHSIDASTRTSNFAINILMRYLSPDNVTSECPHIYSPATVRSLYYWAESRNQLGMLDSKMLTLLISLFGSLSIGTPPPSAYGGHLASRLFEMTAHRSYWAFVLKVGRHKLERGMSLHDSDRFWLMHAGLATVRGSSPPEHLSRDAHGAISCARMHYHIIRRHTRRPEVHAHYLETLLVNGDARLIEVAACDLSFLLRTHNKCFPWLQRLLYRLVVQHGESLSTQSREAILAALWSRICQGVDETSSMVRENSQSCVPLDSDDCNLDAISIARSVSATLFGFGVHPRNKFAKRSGHLLSVFRPTYPLPSRWSSLIMLSVFNSSEMVHYDATDRTSDHTIPQVTSCWQVILGLATVEKLLQDSFSAFKIQTTSTVALSETIRIWHHQWSLIVKSRLIPRDLACAITTSFLKIACTLADAALLYDCQDLYLTEDDSEGPRTLVSKSFAAQYIAAVVRIQGPHPGVVLAALETLFPDSGRRTEALASAVEVLAFIDATLAYKFYIMVQAEGTEPSRVTTLAPTMPLGQPGTLRQTVLFLKDDRLSLEVRRILLSVIARTLRENSQNRRPSSVFVVIVDELKDLYQSHNPPEHFGRPLEQLFVLLSRHGRGSQLLPLVLSIFRGLPRFFQPRFFDRYCHTLVRHKQFSTSNKLLDAITAAHPKVARRLRIQSYRIAVRAKAYLATRRAPLRGPTSLKLSSRLRRSLCTGSSLDHRLQELLKSGRVLAAKHIFTRAAASISSSHCTVLGNVLLHGVSLQRAPRNGRRVRKVLALMEILVKNHGFRPDRVTANILIKTMINWRSAFDSSRLRDLFDQLVRSGYPAADYSPLHLPFGTGRTQVSDTPSLLKLPSSISFKRHSKPLYKMFIKAFYCCNDVEAARKVVGILKVEEYKSTLTLEARRKARSRGRIKAEALTKG